MIGLSHAGGVTNGCTPAMGWIRRPLLKPAPVILSEPRHRNKPMTIKLASRGESKNLPIHSLV